MRRLSVLLAAAGLIAGLAAPATVAAARPVEYLALGDSLAFGYTPYPDPAVGFVGYPELVAPMLRDHLTNASCPGETSSHFIDTTLTTLDHGCGQWRAAAPLHVPYASATQSQLAFADAFLQSHPKTQLITIDMGANDLGLLRDTCTATFPTDPAKAVACMQAGLPGVLARLSDNLDTIYGHIRIADGYVHKIVALTVYSPDYTDTLTTGAVYAVNQIVAARTVAWGGIVADGFGAFAAATAGYGGNSCTAGLLIPLKPGPGCDQHASPDGHKLLATTIVNTLRAD